MRSTPDSFEASARRRYAATLLALFGALFLALGWAPLYREDWLLENVLVIVVLPCLILSHRRLPLSRISYTALFLFLCLHEIGAHYTYSEVPYDAWCLDLFGRDFNSLFGWQRNHFDRVVHFLYGLLIVYPVREIFLRVADAKGFWGYLFPVLVVMSTSLLFELFEWGAALLFGGDLGMAYLGTQGDVWDSHKDSLMATLGALIASVLIAVVHASLDRDFTREWVESLRVKRPEPLGEVSIERMLEERDGDHPA
jgi:putative membrane protein